MGDAFASNLALRQRHRRGVKTPPRRMPWQPIGLVRGHSYPPQTSAAAKANKIPTPCRAQRGAAASMHILKTPRSEAQCRDR